MPSALKLALLPLFWVAAISMAQDISHPFDRKPGCQRGNSSRIGSGCREIPPPPIVVHSEMKFSTHLAAPKVETLDCQAEVAVQYQQSNSIAQVKGTIDNQTCAASSGSMVLAISTSTDTGELQTQEFSRTWQRDDAQPVTFTADYEIGKNADLVRVRALKVKCRCDRAKPEPSGP